MCQGALAPDFNARTLAHRDDIAIRGSHVQSVVVDTQPVIAGRIMRPPHLAGIQGQHRDTPLKTNSVDVVARHIDR